MSEQTTTPAGAPPTGTSASTPAGAPPAGTPSLNLPATTPAGAPPTGTDLTQEQANANPFKAIALMLKTLRTSLEGTKVTGQSPRWVRIARIRDFQGATDYVSVAVVPAVDKGLAYGMVYLLELTLQARDILVQVDSAHAFVEVSEKMLETITTDEFANALTQVVDPKSSVQNPLGGAGNTFKTVMGFIDKIPTPEDLDVIGKELFALLYIEQLPLDDTGLDNTTEKHIKMEDSGKLRLLEMALKKPVTIRGLGLDKKGEQDITYLGSRRLWKLDNSKLPAKAVGEWETDSTKKDTIYEFSFTAGEDIEEVNNLLEKMGYVDPAVPDKKVFGDELVRRLRRFQVLNNLKINGTLDNPTLNRLMHLNYDTKSIERANPFDKDKLKAGFDDTKNA